MLVKSKVKYIQSLSQKKQRDADDVFIAEGPKVINELLKEPSTRLVELFALGEWLNNPACQELLKTHTTAVIHEIGDSQLKAVSHLSTPNMVLGLFQKFVTQTFQPDNRITLVAENIQDPGNIGSIVRCADWFGITHVICSNDCADIYGPKAIQSTMGSIARVQVLYTGLSDFIVRNRRVGVYAAALEGTSLYETAPPNEGLVIVGNESKGISDALMKLADRRVTIPRRGNAESLNAAVATGIILSHLFKD